MNKIVENILKRIATDEEKKKELDSLAEDIKMARGILSGDFRYCPDCSDYYLTRSYIEEIEKKEGQVCIYEDPINSGGNEYADGYIYTTYRTCPKGHKKLINTETERKRR
jgi:hypothetical protein